MTLAVALVFGGEMERVRAGAAADFSATRAWVGCGAEAIVGRGARGEARGKGKGIRRAVNASVAVT